MGVRFAAITPIMFTSSSMNRDSRCNNIYTQYKIKGLLLIFEC